MDYFTEIFGLNIQDFIFTLFLPFIFFYLLLYALLRKSKILGEGAQTNRLNSLISLTISTLGILSLYSFGLTVYLPYLAAFTAIVAFLVLYFLGVTGYAVKKTSSYISGEAFKTKDEKKFDAGVKNCENIWERLQSEKTPATQQKLLSEINSEVSNLEALAKKLGKSLYEFSWYKEYKDRVKAG